MPEMHFPNSSVIVIAKLVACEKKNAKLLSKLTGITTTQTLTIMLPSHDMLFLLNLSDE